MFYKISSSPVCTQSSFMDPSYSRIIIFNNFIFSCLSNSIFRLASLALYHHWSLTYLKLTFHCWLFVFFLQELFKASLVWCYRHFTISVLSTIPKTYQNTFFYLWLNIFIEVKYLSQSSQAAITKYWKMRSLNKRNLFSCSPRGWNSEMRVPTWSEELSFWLSYDHLPASAHGVGEG